MVRIGYVLSVVSRTFQVEDSVDVDPIAHGEVFLQDDVHSVVINVCSSKSVDPNDFGDQAVFVEVVVLAELFGMIQVHHGFGFGDCFEQNIEIMGTKEKFSTLSPFDLGYFLDGLRVEDYAERVLKVDIVHRLHNLFKDPGAKACYLVIQRFDPSKLFLEDYALPMIHSFLKVGVSRELVNAEDVVTCKVYILDFTNVLRLELDMGDQHSSQKREDLTSPDGL